MAWFAHHWLAYLMYLPIAAAFALRPWMRLRDEAMRLRPGQQGHHVACQVGSRERGCGGRGGAFMTI